jgi:hypothetical protein
VDASVLEPELGSNLTDLHDLPLGEGVDLAVTTTLAYQIIQQDGVLAFNSAI